MIKITENLDNYASIFPRDVFRASGLTNMFPVTEWDNDDEVICTISPNNNPEKKYDVPLVVERESGRIVFILAIPRLACGEYDLNFTFINNDLLGQTKFNATMKKALKVVPELVEGNVLLEDSIYFFWEDDNLQFIKVLPTNAVTTEILAYISGGGGGGGNYAELDNPWQTGTMYAQHYYLTDFGTPTNDDELATIRVVKELAATKSGVAIEPTDSEFKIITSGNKISFPKSGLHIYKLNNATITFDLSDFTANFSGYSSGYSRRHTSYVLLTQNATNVNINPSGVPIQNTMPSALEAGFYRVDAIGVVTSSGTKYFLFISKAQ